MFGLVCSGDHEPDMDAVYEEMARMREVVMAEVDTDRVSVTVRKLIFLIILTSRMT
jgi:hypothetical protein